VSLENVFLEIANMNTSHDVVILSDRGLMDGSAFVDDMQW